MSNDSITDFDVVARNREYVGLLFRSLPHGMVLDFFERANEWELNQTLSRRLASQVSAVAEVLGRTPGLTTDTHATARKWAEQRLRHQALAFTVAAQLECGSQSAVRIEWIGLEHLNAIREDGRAAILIAPHLGLFHLVPYVLRTFGEEVAVLGERLSVTGLLQSFSPMSPRLTDGVELIPVPDPASALRAFHAVRSGTFLAVYPEFDLGATSAARTANGPFLGRDVRLPTAATRLARMSGSPLLPLSVIPYSPRRVRVRFEPQVGPPPTPEDDSRVARQLLGWVEESIKQDPTMWWSWLELDTIMAVDSSEVVSRH